MNTTDQKVEFVFCSVHSTSVLGNGGAHRLHQVISCFRRAFPDCSICELEWGSLPASTFVESQKSTLQRKLHRLAEKAGFLTEKVDGRNLLGHRWFHFWDDECRNQAYERILIEKLRTTRVVSVLQGAAFSRAMGINSKHSVPSILFPDNFDSLAENPSSKLEASNIPSLLRLFEKELRILSQANLCLTISQVEYGFLNGIGMKSRLLPYFPSGNCRNDLESLRKNASTRSIKHGLVVIGSVSWAPTRIGITDLLDSIRANRFELPCILRVIGHGSEQLEKAGDKKLGIEFLGKLPREEFHEALSNCFAAIVPVTCGFGAITRIPDLACAGVPVITSQLAVTHQPPPEGVYPVSDWAELPGLLLQDIRGCSYESFKAWEKSQTPDLRKWVMQAIPHYF